MGRLLLLALAALSPWATVFATEITSTFTTLIPTTAIVTSSSAIADCTVKSSMQIACSDGYYNVYGFSWQETCAASISGGSLLLSSEGLSLRACAGGCSVRSSCTAVTWDSTNNICYLWEGDVTVTSGGSYQAAVRSASTANPCTSTWLVTETETITSTGEVVYTVSTPSSTPAAVTPSSTPDIQSSVSRSPSSPSPSSVVPTSARTTLSSPSRSIPASSSPSSSSPSSSSSSRSSSPFFTYSVWLLFYFLLFLLADYFFCGAVVDSIDQTFGHVFRLDQFFFAQSTVTSCAVTVTDCPANQQKTYLTTETITYVTTFCPEADQITAQPAAATGSAALPTVVSQTYNAQQASTQTDSASWAQTTEIGIPSSQSTTSTAYVTEVEVVTACPPSVLDCPVEQKSTYTTTKTVAAYTMKYFVAVTDSAQASQLTSAVVHPIAVPNLSLAHSHAPNPTHSGDNANYTLPHALSSSLWKAGPASSGVTQAMHATTMNTVVGKLTSSVTTSAPGSLFTGDAPKMGQFSTLFTVVAMLSSLLLMC
ncbi:hypothetical protein N7504_003265 [Penicillium tannophilum]|nr:hypothetical protein N7504_003265 [Penicillium tannophilum]